MLYINYIISLYYIIIILFIFVLPIETSLMSQIPKVTNSQSIGLVAAFSIFNNLVKQKFGGIKNFDYLCTSLRISTRKYRYYEQEICRTQRLEFDADE